MNSVRILITAKDEISGHLDKIRDKASLLSKTDIGKGMLQGAGIAAFGMVKNAALGALDAVVQFGVGSVKAASDQREAMSLTQQVFEGSTESVKTWARSQKDAFSSTEAMQFASSFGTAFKNVGMALDETTAKAKEMTTLAGDLGSAFNTSSEEAAVALRAGLLGESEPLRRFGVFLDEAKVKAKAASMGIAALGTTLTDGQKVAARYALIMEQTADSQGMFGRDSGSLADAQKKLNTNMEDLAATVGEKVLPPLVELVGTLSDLATEAARTGGPVDQLSDVWSDFTNSFDPDPIYESKTAVGELDAAVTEFIEDSIDWLTPWDTFVAKADEIAAAEAKIAQTTSESADEFVTSSREMDRSLDSVKDSATTTRVRMRRLGDSVGDTAGDFKDLVKWANNAGDALAEASYGPEELELAFEGARLELKDNQKEVGRLQGKMDELEKEGKKVPRTLKREFNDAEQAVNESKQEVIRLGTRLRTTGGISMADLRTEFSRLGIKIDTTSSKAADLWWYMNHIANVDLGTAYDNVSGGRHRAAGGPVSPYQTYMVGENNPELLHTGSSGGRVMPSAGGASGGGGGMTLNLTVSTPMLTPGGAEALAAAIVPHITRSMQRTGMIGR